jgi:patatin-like phospholipase/acyl hydrolase
MLTHNETCLASFPNRQPACTVWEAGRATSAAQTYFDPMKLEGRFFTDGGISYNNPIFTIEKQLPLASLNRQSNRQCYVSIGTGKASPANQETARSSWKLSHVFSPIENLLQAATQAEKDAEAFHSFCELLHDPMIGKHCYHFRFNCDNGLAEIELDEAEKLPIIIRQTQEYLQRASVQADINRCVTVINGWL